MTIPDGVLAAIFVTGILFAIWTSIIIFERLEYNRSKPKSPRVVEYDGPEPIGYDLDEKFWDDPQWEQPPYSSNVPKYMLNYDGILTTNEIRTLNLEHYIQEATTGSSIILSEGMDLKIMDYSGNVVRRIPPYPSVDDHL